jgi:hypothetical protein
LHKFDSNFGNTLIGNILLLEGAIFCVSCPA